MNSFSSVLDVAVRLGRAFDQLQIPYLIGGSVASSILGERRFTNDIDVAVRMTEAQVHPFAEALGPDFVVDEESLREEIRKRGSWNLIENKSGLKIDLFFTSDMLDRSAFERRRPVKVNAEGDRIFLPTPEDMILRKLLWFLSGGKVSERQWRDVVQMIRLGANLDDKYLDKWADWLDIQKLLADARKEAATPPTKPP